MTHRILRWLTLSLFLLSTPIYGRDWALTEAELGWNNRELVTLYFHNSELQTQWAWEALSHYQFKGDENILDFGCGDGKLSALMSFMVPEGAVTGVDISESMLAYSRKMFPASYYKNLAFHRSEDVDFELVLSGESYDLVTSFCVFHLVPNPQTVFLNIRKKMKDSGSLVLTLPIGRNREFFLAALKEMEKRGLTFPEPTHESVQMRDPEVIGQVLSDSGFELQRLDVVPCRFPFASKEEMVDWFEGTLTANWNIPKEKRRDLFTAIADRYLDYRPDDRGEEGFVYFSISRVDVLATPK